MKSGPVSSSRSNGKIARYFRRRLLWCAVVLPVAVLCLQAPVNWWGFELARHFHLYWLAGVLLAGAAAICYRCFARALLCAVALGILAWPLREYWPAVPDAAPVRAGSSGAPADGRGKEVRLISCNLLLLARGQAETLEALDRADPDLLLLLEFTPEWRRVLSPVLTKYRWYAAHAQPDPMGIWFGSKLPLSEQRVVEAGGPDYPTVVARVEVGGAMLGFVGAHPMNPVLPAWSAIWRKQFEEYPALLDSTRTEARVFAGDLNCTPFARTFQTFLASTGLRDSARGRGLFNTWSPGLGWWAGLPIDHVLVSQGVTVLDRRAGPRIASDHRWVEVRLRVEGSAR